MRYAECLHRPIVIINQQYTKGEIHFIKLDRLFSRKWPFYGRMFYFARLDTFPENVLTTLIQMAIHGCEIMMSHWIVTPCVVSPPRPTLQGTSP